MLDIIAASDRAGQQLLEELLSSLSPVYTHAVALKAVDDYAHVARMACAEVLAGRARRALLVCGTGIGVSISANKIPGMRAAVCHDLYSAQRSVLSNDCQVLCFGARIISAQAATQILSAWLPLTFDPSGPSGWKVDAIE